MEDSGGLGSSEATVFLPHIWLRTLLRRTDKLKLFRKYVDTALKAQNNRMRIAFLKNCLGNDLIPRFLMFRVPPNGCFEQTIVHNFQRRLLRLEVRNALSDLGKMEEKLNDLRRCCRQEIPSGLLPSVLSHLRRELKLNLATLAQKHRNKLDLLSQRQGKPLSNIEETIKILDGIVLPETLLNYLALGPKHPVKDQFNEMHFLADVDNLLHGMKLNGASNDDLNEVNALAQWYCRKMRKQRPDPMLKKVNSYLKKEGIKAVPFDKGMGFCMMKEETYWNKLNDILQGEQFKRDDRRRKSDKDTVITNENRFNATLKQMKDDNKISDEVYNAIRSTGAQPARLYGLAKVHKKDTPLRPVLSLPGSQYDRINKWLAKLFEKVPGANIETSTQEVCKEIRDIKLEDDETIFSMDVKSLYTNVPVLEAISIACEALYDSNSAPDMEQDTLTQLMQLAVTNVWFMCGTDWYIQTDGVAMGASMAVILSNMWMKKFEAAISAQNSEDNPRAPNTTVWGTPIQNGPDPCGKCGINVSNRGYSFRCATCRFWYHRKNCTDISLEQAKHMRKKAIWECGCNRIPHATQTEEAKFFKRYVDDIIRSAKSDEIDRILEMANNLHPNLEFTIEKLNEANEIPFLDMKLRLNQGLLSSSWYQKPTDTGLMLSFRAMAPTIYKKNIIEGTVHRIFNATSTWQAFRVGLEKAMVDWENNQYPPQFYNPIVRRTIDKLVSAPSVRQPDVVTSNARKPTAMTIQYRGVLSDQLASKLRSKTDTKLIFTMKKLKTALPSLKSKVDKMVRSHVVYEIKCPGCKASYVGQTARQMTRRLQEHCNTSSPLGKHLEECDIDQPGKKYDAQDVKILDTANNVPTLLTLEALYISKYKPPLNQKEEYRSRPLTLKL